jgi:hypothetical protein
MLNYHLLSQSRRLQKAASTRATHLSQYLTGTHLHAFSVDSVASIFSMGGTIPNNSTCGRGSAAQTVHKLQRRAQSLACVACEPG